MVYKTSRKSSPTPLKDVQFAVQADDPRRYLFLDTHSSLSSPTYSVGQQANPSSLLSLSLHENQSAWQARVPASSDSLTYTLPCVASHLLNSPSSPLPLARVEHSIVLSPRVPKHCWNDLLDSQDDRHPDPVHLHSLWPYRSFTPPISPPVSSLPETDTEYSSKRSGMTFSLVPAEVDDKPIFTHIVVDRRANDTKGNGNLPSISSGENGLPEDMQDILRQLDDLASWVKAASSSRDCISDVKSAVHATCLTGHPGTDACGDGANHPNNEVFPNKGKSRSLSATPPNSGCGTRQDLVGSSRGAMPGNSTNTVSRTGCQSEGFIYVPNRNTPEFLVGSSNSPIAYPVCGYSSHPSHYSPHPSGLTHDISYHRRFLERRSTPSPSPTSSLASSPSGKTSFKTLFQRSRCNTTAVSRPSVTSGHVPVEGALRQGKRMRLPWLKI